MSKLSELISLTKIPNPLSKELLLQLWRLPLLPRRPKPLNLSEVTWRKSRKLKKLRLLMPLLKLSTNNPSKKKRELLRKQLLMLKESVKRSSSSTIKLLRAFKKSNKMPKKNMIRLMLLLNLRLILPSRRPPRASSALTNLSHKRSEQLRNEKERYI